MVSEELEILGCEFGTKKGERCLRYAKGQNEQEIRHLENGDGIRTQWYPNGKIRSFKTLYNPELKQKSKLAL